MASNIISMTPAERTRYDLAGALLQDAIRPQPIRTHLQGVGQLAKALSGAYQQDRVARDAQDRLQGLADAFQTSENPWGDRELMAGLFSVDPSLGINFAAQGAQMEHQRAEDERQRQIQEALLGAGPQGNPFYGAAVLDGDPATAYAISQDQPGVYGAPSSAPRGVANNNPLNLVHSGDQWQGMAPDQTDPAFVQFETPEDGIRAAAINLRSYAERGIGTVGDAIREWAPSGHGNNDPEAYISAVEQMTGYGPDTPLNVTDSRFMGTLLQAMATVENGQPISPDVVARGVQMAFTPTVQSEALPPPGFFQPPPAPDYGQPPAPSAALPNIPGGATFHQDTGQPRTVSIGGQDYYVGLDNQPIAPVPPTPAEPPPGYQATDTGVAPIPGSQQWTAQINELRDEWNQQTREFSEAERSFQAMQNYAAEGTAQSDIALIFAFFKTIDPTSTVREGEFATAASSMGLPEQMIQGLEQLANGERLPEDVRRAFVRAAGLNFSARQQQAGVLAEQYSSIANARGLPVDQIITFDPFRTPVPGATNQSRLEEIRQQYGLE